MKPTLEQIKTDESVWPEGAELYDKDIEVFYKKGKGRMELLEVTGEWVKSSLSEPFMGVMIPRPAKAFVPEVNQVCEINFPLNEWTKVEYLATDRDGYYICKYMNGEIEKFKGVGIEFRLIKSERDLFNDAVSEALENGNIHEGLGNVMYDSGKFKLVEPIK